MFLAQGVIAEWDAFGPGHYRINGELDVWPRRRKYLFHPTKENGTYRDSRDFVELVCP